MSAEKLHGEARRLGEEGLFQLGMVESIRELFSKYNVKKVITQCPHCFTTLKNDYRQYGVELQVIHHTEFIQELLASGRLERALEVAQAALRTLSRHHPPDSVHLAYALVAEASVLSAMRRPRCSTSPSFTSTFDRCA